MLLLYLLGTILSVSGSDKHILRILNAIPDKTWTTTESSRIAQMSDDDFRSMLMDTNHNWGVAAEPMTPFIPDDDVPESYDCFDKYPECEGDIFDQGKCGGCWSFAATSTFTDRRCIAGKTNGSVALSQQYQISCDRHNMGCDGGTLYDAWNFFLVTGVPTLACVGYSRGAFIDGVTTPCPKTCNDGSQIEHIKLAKMGEEIHSDMEGIKAAIFKEGPVSGILSLYMDIKYYKHGIYRHHTGRPAGSHAIEIVGYGSENGTDFWRVRNSWGDDWGEDGFLRIVRGVNECNIENYVIAGIA